MARFYVGQRLKLSDTFIVKEILPNHKYLLEADHYYFGPVYKPTCMVGCDIHVTSVYPPIKELKLRLAAWCERMALRLKE